MTGAQSLKVRTRDNHQDDEGREALLDLELEHFGATLFAYCLMGNHYHAVLVDRDAYFLEVCRYVDLDPVRAGMVCHPLDWRHSDYRAHAGESSGNLRSATSTAFVTQCTKNENRSQVCISGLRQPNGGFEGPVLMNFMVESPHCRLIGKRSVR